MTTGYFDAQVGYAIESPSGTFTAPTTAIEHVSSTLKSTPTYIESKGHKAGRRGKHRRLRGNEVVAGTITHEVSPINIGKLLTQAMGAVNTSGSGPYTHAFTAGPLVQTQTMSVQVGMPDETGTVNPFNFVGCQIAKGKFSIKQNEPVMMAFDWVGQHLQNAGDGDTPASLTSASYASGWSPFTSMHGVLTIASSEFEFDTCDIDFDNMLRTGHYTVRSTTPRYAKVSKEQGRRMWGATVTSDLHSLTAMNRAFSAAEVAWSLALTNGASSLTFAGNTGTNGDTAVLSENATGKQTLNFDFLSSSTDAAAFTITQVTSESSP